MTTELAILEAPFTKQDRLAAKNIVREVDYVLTAIRNQETSLANNYVTLANLLLKVRAKKYWLLWDFQSFGSYIRSIQDRVEKGRTQLYEIIGVSEKLLPAMSEQDLIDIGITKAKELKRYVAQTDRKPPKDLIELAKDPATTVAQLREAVFVKTNAPRDFVGTYWDLGGFYVTAEEKKELDYAFDLATKVDPVIPRETPDWIRKKSVIQRLAAEFVSTYGPK